ncbi:lysophospholipid acyltransferase family protein [uncultured Draconibacterium sp.]|uniref:lysophospholipid acyltransferase family protein n=1 Tax=uncultured Draconibacterium sp. TaxID=1573823 RepID=UPI00325FE058
MIIKAKHHFFLDPFFRYYVLWKMKRSFQSFSVVGKVHDNGLPVLLICNHISWWDGIWTLYTNQQLFKRKYHFMMLEEELRKNWFFQYTGGFSVKKQSRTIIETLDYTAELLGNTNNLVLMFPQGKINSMHKNNFVFEKGIQKILERTKNEIQIIFQANFVDYLSTARPQAYFYVGTYLGTKKVELIEKSYNQFYQQCLNTQVQKSE